MTIGQILNKFYNNLKDTFASKNSLATVATSGSYNDLNDKPEPPVQAQADWNQNNSEAPDHIKNRICYEGAPETVVYDILEADMGSGNLIGQDPNYSSYYFFDFPEGFAPKQGVTYTLHAKDQDFVVTWNWNSFPQFVSGYNGGGEIKLNDTSSVDYTSCKYYIRLGFDGSYYEGSKLTWEAAVTTQDTKIVDPKFLPEGIGYDVEPIDIVGNVLTWNANGSMEGTTNNYYYFNPTEPILPDNTYYIYFPKDDLYVQYSQGGTAESGSGGGSFGQGGGGFYWNVNGLDGAPNGETASVQMSGNPYFFKNETAYFICKSIKKVPDKYISAAGLKLPNNAEIFNDYTYNKATGTYSHAEGGNTEALSSCAHAEGGNTRALESNTHVEGSSTVATGYSAHAEGSGSIAKGQASHAEGHQVAAVGDYSHAEGDGTMTEYSVTKVDSTTLSTNSNLSEHVGEIIRYVDNYYTIISATYSSPTTTLTIAPSIPDTDSSRHMYLYPYSAIGSASHIEGFLTKASGNYSHAEGEGTTAKGQSSHAEGDQTIASGSVSHAEGIQTTASGTTSHAEGYSTTASGNYSHAEGYSTTASGNYSHAEGNRTTASVTYSHAEGNNTTASGNTSHAEGQNTKASGYATHTEGYSSTASGSYSHAEGNYTRAYGEGSHAEGKGSDESIGLTYVSSGKYDCNSSGDKTYLKGAYCSYNETNYRITAATYNSSTQKTRLSISGLPASNITIYVTNGQAAGSYSNSINSGNIASGDYSHAEGYYTKSVANTSHTEGYVTTTFGEYSHAEGSNTTTNGQNSHAEGSHTITSGQNSHAEGYNTYSYGQNSHAEGEGNNNESITVSCIQSKKYTISGNYLKYNKIYVLYNNVRYAINSASYDGSTDLTTFTINGLSTISAGTNIQLYICKGTTIGKNSHSEGYITIATGQNSHAEGNNTIASGDYTHAEGYNTVALYQSSHAEGNNTAAEGAYSHTEGNNTSAKGTSTHAEGDYTTAGGDYSHAEGNITTANGMYSHSEGNHTIAQGTSSHAEGDYTRALSDFSHAEGHYAVADGLRSHVECGSSYAPTMDIQYTSSNPEYEYQILGDYTNLKNTFILYNDEIYKITNAVSTGSGATKFTIQDLKHTGTQGTYRVRLIRTQASGASSHAEGDGTKAMGEYSHAEGYESIANGSSSHAEGYQSSANGFGSHAEGEGSIANGNGQHVSGQYNVSDDLADWVSGASYVVGDRVKHKPAGNINYSTYECIADNSDSALTNTSHWKNLNGRYNYAEIVGNGTATDARSNARTLDWDGNEVLAGTLSCSGVSVNGTPITPTQAMSQAQVTEFINNL